RHGDLARLAERDDLAVDAPLAVLQVLAGDLAGTRDRVAGPHSRREAHLVAAEGLGTDEVGEAFGDEAGGQHPLAGDGRVPGHLRELLVGVDRVEVAGGAGVPDEIGAREAVDDEARDLLTFLHVLEVRHPCTAPSVSMTVLREYATTSPR